MIGAIDIAPALAKLGVGPPQAATPEHRADMATARYWEGYFHVRALNRFGATVKTVALSAGGLLALLGFLLCARSVNNLFDTGGFAGFATILFGALVAGFGYVLGVLVQARAQLLKAHFDCAVNSSHFLSDDQKAKVMSLD
jgi:hypothetical protein